MVIKIKDGSEIPVYQQLRDQIVAGISDGRLAPGERLPAVRVLAMEIGINAMTVNKAYQLLKQEGFILIDRRHGARVKDHMDGGAELPREKQELLRQLAAEARARGISQKEFLALCEGAYGEGDAL